MQLLLEALASILEVNIRPTIHIPLSSETLGAIKTIWTTEGKERLSGAKFQDAHRITHVM